MTARYFLLTQVPGKTLGVAVASYNFYEDALNALAKLNNLDVLGRKLNCSWKDPNFDIVTELSFETRVLYIKNISTQTTVPRLKEICEKYGKVFRIKKYATKAFIEFDSIKASKEAFEGLNDKRIDGLIWKIFPARKYDAEKERDLPDRNICFSKNFISEADQQVLLKFAYDGTVPEIDEKILTSCNKIIENVKSDQKRQVDQLNYQLENWKVLQGNNGSKTNGNNSYSQMMMLYLMNLNMGSMMNTMSPGMTGMPNMQGMNQLMPGMPGMPGMPPGGQPGATPGANSKGFEGGQLPGQGLPGQDNLSNSMNQMMGINMPGMNGQQPGQAKQKLEGEGNNSEEAAKDSAQAMAAGGQNGLPDGQNNTANLNNMMQNMFQMMNMGGGNGVPGVGAAPGMNPAASNQSAPNPANNNTR